MYFLEFGGQTGCRAPQTIPNPSSPYGGGVRDPSEGYRFHERRDTLYNNAY